MKKCPFGLDAARVRLSTTAMRATDLVTTPYAKALLALAGLCLALTAVGLASQPAAEAGTTEILVKKGDTLSIIAREYLDDPGRWRELLKYNQISDPNMIKPGMKLKVPARLAKKPMAIVQLWRGTAEFQRKGDPVWKGVQPMLGLFLEDAVRTAQKSGLQLKVRDGVELSIEENTFIVLNEKVTGENRSFNVLLKSGGLRTAIDTKKIGGPFRMQMITPTAVASVRGTEFMTAVDGSETTMAACYDGVVEVTAQGKTVSLTAGFGTYVKKGEAPVQPFELPEAPSLDEDIEIQ